MCSKAIVLEQVTKAYYLFDRPVDRLWSALGLKKSKGRMFSALKEVSFSLDHGEVIGIVGRNGSGKSTLLQLIAGTLVPTEGRVSVNGRVAALLELGAGFNPEFTGRENIFLNAALLGLKEDEIRQKLDEIIAFSELGSFIEQPVKTYSSGMTVRLAFAIATSVEADVIIIDEALSVGDGAFAKKSFDRIMALKESGKTILFCSHNLYQVEALCHRALWLNKGVLEMDAEAGHVLKAYESFLYSGDLPEKPDAEDTKKQLTLQGSAHFDSVRVFVDDVEASLDFSPVAISGESTLKVVFEWVADPDLPSPSVAATIHSEDGRMVSSAGSHIDEVVMETKEGQGYMTLYFPRLPLLKGSYWVEVYLMCERGILFYDQKIPIARFEVKQTQYVLEQGLVHLKHQWSTEK